jgi:hypothetical protein
MRVSCKQGAQLHKKFIITAQPSIKDFGRKHRGQKGLKQQKIREFTAERGQQYIICYNWKASVLEAH